MPTRLSLEDDHPSPEMEKRCGGRGASPATPLLKHGGGALPYKYRFSACLLEKMEIPLLRGKKSGGFLSHPLFLSSRRGAAYDGSCQICTLASVLAVAT